MSGPLTLLLAVAVAAATGCGGGGEEVAAGDQPPGDSTSRSATRRAPGARPRRATDIQWEDPEPAGAQEQAESVVGAAWNSDKTTQLSMHITTLVDKTSGIEGFASGLAAREASLDERLAKLGAEVTGSTVTIRLAGSVLFDFDKADIRPDAERTLREVTEVVRELAPRPVRIEGHTDSIASEGYNQALSERRAAAVREWLAAHGVEAARLRTIGRGEGRPVADNSTAEGRQRNRRVEVVIEKP